MEDLKRSVYLEISSLEQESKISKMQMQYLRTLMQNQEEIEILTKNPSRDDIRSEILKICKSISCNVSIPQGYLPDDVSSPMDTFLLSKKRSVSNQICLQDSPILNRMELECSSEIDTA